MHATGHGKDFVVIIQYMFYAFELFALSSLSGCSHHWVGPAVLCVY